MAVKGIEPSEARTSKQNAKAGSSGILTGCWDLGATWDISDLLPGAVMA